MFVKYQTVRAFFLGGVVLVAGASYLLYVSSGSKEEVAKNDNKNVPSTLDSPDPKEVEPSATSQAASEPTISNAGTPSSEAIPSSEGTVPSQGLISNPQGQVANPVVGTDSKKDLADSKKDLATLPVVGTKATASEPQGELAQRLIAAMKIANSKATVAQGKDVLGKSNPWKLNLYDDNNDGQWDRAKLDTNRDDIDDEKWNYKEGRWEKEGGGEIWSGDAWVSAASSNASKSNPSTNAKDKSTGKSTDGNALDDASRYRDAMKIATGKAVAGKGKDVLGAKNPWKLNLYDDDNDGKWDRGKLDKNRDDVDDEKWNFKNGSWERDGGSSTWDGEKWTGPAAK